MHRGTLISVKSIKIHCRAASRHHLRPQTRRCYRRSSAGGGMAAPPSSTRGSLAESRLGPCAAATGASGGGCDFAIGDGQRGAAAAAPQRPTDFHTISRARTRHQKGGRRRPPSTLAAAGQGRLLLDGLLWTWTFGFPPTIPDHGRASGRIVRCYCDTCETGLSDRAPSCGAFGVPVGRITTDGISADCVQFSGHDDG